MARKRAARAQVAMWDAFLKRTHRDKALFTIEETRNILGCARQTVHQRIDSR